MTERRPGTDHPHFAYAPLPQRRPLRWPGNAPLAVTLVLYLEHWELEPPEGSFRDPRFKDINGYFAPDHLLYSLKEYGNRVGIFRILDCLDRHGVNVTVAANASACRHYPFLVDAFLKRGYEIAAHGLSATQMITSLMTPDEERAFIRGSLETVEAYTGHRPAGWIGQDYGESASTPRLLAEAGLSYVMDWPNDDQPFAMTLDRPMVSIPNQADWDDVQLLWHRRVGAQHYPSIVMKAAERLRADGAATGRFMGIAIHPWVQGAPHRIRHFEDALARLLALPGLWVATAGELARHVLASAPAGPSGPVPSSMDQAK